MDGMTPAQLLEHITGAVDSLRSDFREDLAEMRADMKERFDNSQAAVKELNDKVAIQNGKVFKSELRLDTIEKAEERSITGPFKITEERSSSDAIKPPPSVGAVVISITNHKWFPWLIVALAILLVILILVQPEATLKFLGVLKSH